MDDQTTRNHIQAHANAVVSGDMDTVVADLSEELQPQAPALAQGLPAPVTEAEVLRLDVAEDETVAEIRYTGDSGEVTLRSRWQDGEEHPVIVHIEPVG
jgi:hypothetical protein